MQRLALAVIVVLVSLPLYHGFFMEEGHGTLISNEMGATCEEYKIINCKVQYVKLLHCRNSTTGNKK